MWRTICGLDIKLILIFFGHPSVYSPSEICRKYFKEDLFLHVLGFACDVYSVLFTHIANLKKTSVYVITNEWLSYGVLMPRARQPQCIYEWRDTHHPKNCVSFSANRTVKNRRRTRGCWSCVPQKCNGNGVDVVYDVISKRSVNKCEKVNTLIRHRWL